MAHKYFHLIASYKIRASLWLSIVHDWSKFRLSEFMPYARAFYTPDGYKHFENSQPFKKAWLVHQHRNKHHWEYWLLKKRDGSYEALDMPDKYVREMVADWMAAGRAINGRWEYKEWYQKNKENIVLSLKTELYVEHLIFDDCGAEDERTHP